MNTIINFKLLRDDVVDNYATWFDISIEQAEKEVLDDTIYEIIEEMYDRQTEIMHREFTEAER